MKKLTTLIIIILPMSLNAQIIADHTIVNDYVNIPQQYIDSVKTMWVQLIGESHSGAYRYGINLLAEQNPKYAGIGQEGGDPNPPTNENLRLSRTWWYDDPLDSDPIEWTRLQGGEEEFWTTPWAVNNIKTNISYCNEEGNNPLAAVGFAWCWDMCMGTGGEVDETYGCRWGGRCFYWNGTEFITSTSAAYYWGLDAEDNSLVDAAGTKENVVNMQTYIDAIEEINAHDQNTLCFFTTGPVDNMYSAQSGTTDTRNEGESGYQRYLKHEYLRDYVKINGGVLFDFADILSHNDAGELYTTTWDGHPTEPKTFPLIHPDNNGEYNGGAGSCHIDSTGCIRLAKAMWWMLARVAGWESSTGNSSQPISGVLVNCSPNPFSDKLTINLSLNKNADVHIELTDFSGRIYHQRDYQNLSEGTHTLEFPDNKMIPNGIYICKVSSENIIITKKLVKVHP